MSSGNANTTISHPGAGWQMLWDNGGFSNFQLDIVGFLAVLGEGAVTANAQVSALSTLFYLPRLMPAPQALLWPTRPTTLPSTAGTVTGAESGNVKKHVHHVAHVLLGDEMPTFMVRCVEVTKNKQERIQSWKDRFFGGEQQQAKKTKSAEDAKARAMTQTPASSGPPLIKAMVNGPLTWVTLLGCFLSLTLFVNSLIWGDGMSLIATLLLSLLSTLVGFGNKWSLRLPSRPKGTELSVEGHVVIRYPNGSFLVVKCDETVARELYFAPEEIDYNLKSLAAYRLISLVGTLMLMLGVIALANAKLQMQFAWAGAYIIINIGHWLAAAVPSKMHWDLSCYNIKEHGIEGGPASKTFTDALFKAIVFTKSVNWVKNGEAAPTTEVWAEWLHEADRIVQDAGCHTGPLCAPFWPGENPEKSTIWELPQKWDAKDEWDRINDNFITEKPKPQVQIQTRVHTV